MSDYSSTTFAERRAALEAEGRHPGTLGLLRYFEFDHLPEPMRDMSAECAVMALNMVRRLPDGPELTAGLRKLLEAKDCFVRCALPPG